MHFGQEQGQDKRKQPQGDKSMVENFLHPKVLKTFISP